MIATDTPVPMHTQLRELLRLDIIEGRFSPLSRLPSEAQLSEQHGVSRITVRHALGALQNEGLIFKVQGKGAFVSQPKARQDVTTLKGFDEAMAPLGHKIRNDLLSFEQVEADRNVAARLDLAAGAVVVKIRRLRYLDNLPISVDESYFPLDVGLDLASKDLVNRDIFLIIENDLATELGKAQLAIEAAQADGGTAKLLDVPTGAPILRIERLTYSAAGRPIDFEYLYYRSDRFRYELAIQRSRAVRA